MHEIITVLTTNKRYVLYTVVQKGYYIQLYKRGTIYSCTKEVLPVHTVVQKRYYIQLYKRGTTYSCTKEVLYTVVQKRY